MIALTSFLSVFIPGFLAAKLLSRRVSLPAQNLLCASVAFPLGAGLFSLILFFSYLAAGSQGPQLTVTLAGLATTTFIILLWPDSFSPGALSKNTVSAFDSLHKALQAWFGKALNLSSLSEQERRSFLCDAAAKALLLVVFVHFWIYFWGQITGNAHGGWDARYFWKLKARFFYRTPSEWMGMFSPVPGDWSHPDYPLMLPGTFAWSWIITGKESLIAPVLVSLSFSLSLVALIFWYLSCYVSRLSACLCSAFLMTVNMWRFWSTTLYADIPLTFFITAAGLFLVLSLRTKNPALLTAAGLFSGLGLWTKDEGLLFFGWMALLILITQGTALRSLQKAPKSALPYALGAALPLAAVFIIKSLLGTTGGQYLGSGRSLADFAHLLLGNPVKSKIIAAVFGVFAVNFAQWNGLWILTGLAAFAGGKETLRGYRWVFLTLTIMLWTGYFVILHITPHDLKFQIETALLRIMSHAMGFGILFIGESLFRKDSAALSNP